MKKKVYLTQDELKTLKESNVSDKEIEKLQKYLELYGEHLSSFTDLVGDSKVPSKLFYFNMKHFGYLFDDDPNRVITKKDVVIRKVLIDKLIRLLGPAFLQSKQVFENKSDLMPGYEEEKLPDDPVIWAPNHHFKDDVLASYLATKRQSYILFGSVPQFYNTIDGILAYLVGSLMTNRKVSSSKKASIEKAKKAYELGSDVLCFPEGIWDKYPNHLLLDFWPGIYRIANETGQKVVPIVHYIYDPTQKIDNKINKVHTVVDNAIDLTKFSEKAGLEYLRDVMATWYYLMMEKYGKTSRKELADYYNKRKENYSEYNDKELTTNDMFEIYLKDLLSTVDWYDSEIELSYDYRPKDKVRPEDAFGAIANISNINADNIKQIQYAKEITRLRKKEDYQRRF